MCIVLTTSMVTNQQKEAEKLSHFSCKSSSQIDVTANDLKPGHRLREIIQTHFAERTTILKSNNSEMEINGLD